MSVEAQKAKQIVIDEIKEKLDGAQSAVVIDYMGITVAQADAMRKKLREANVDYTVYKNTLVKRAIAGTEFEGLAEVLDGPSALAISKEDATAPASNQRIQEDGIQSRCCRRQLPRQRRHPGCCRHSVKRSSHC